MRVIMNPTVHLQSKGTNFSFRKSEAIFVLLFLCIGAWTTFSFFRGAHNPNDMSFLGTPFTKGVSDNLILYTGCLKNFSGVPLRSISVIGDAYDENGRIIGTSSFIPSPGAFLSPSDTLLFNMNITVLSGCQSVKSIMAIPHSQFGTGKIFITDIKWREVRE